MPIVARDWGGALSRQPHPSAATARLYDLSPGAGRHAMAKPMPSRPFAGVWLERPLHLSLVSFVPVTLVWGISRRGDEPVKQVQSTRQDDHFIRRAKTRVHQTAGTGPGNLAHDSLPAKRQAQRQVSRGSCTIPGHPASSPRRPHLWMLVWRTFRPEGLELVTEAQQLWNDCSDSLKSQVSEATWRAWFSAIRPVAVANGTLVLAVPSGVVRDRLEGRFHGLVHDALLDSSGKEVQFRFRRADRRPRP